MIAGDNRKLGVLRLSIPTDPAEQKYSDLYLEIYNQVASQEKSLNSLISTKTTVSKKVDEPELRFPEFTGKWKSFYLSEVLKERNEQRVQDENFPLVSFTVEKGVTPKTERYDREALVVGDKVAKKYKVTYFGDLVYNPANLKFGAIALNLYGTAVFSPIYVTFEVSKKHNNFFIINSITRYDFLQRLLMFQEGTVYERQAVKPKVLLAHTCKLPSLDEQQKVGNFFKEIDKKINHLEKTLTVTKDLKEALTFQLFTNSPSYPRLRFSGFSGKWLSSTLSKFLKVPKQEKVKLQSIDQLITVKLQLKGVVPSSRYNIDPKSNTQYYKRKAGQLIYGKLDFFNRAIAIIPPEFNGRITTKDVPSFDIKNIDSKFLLENIGRESFINSKLKFGNGGRKAKRISESDFLSFEIYTPSLEEQQKIGNFLTEVDQLISAYQRSLDQHKKLKKALVQRMFV
ncbi:hypothetical protein CJP74_02120 [Psittacicella melopsittaci]|uniref:Type I restriction modification DNA specificity domain-containing protein n=1 Tax=Psittacicella melopsittaci TaxID=2028576 RepID=A0A3A1Y4Y0_9GAMM|nr:restriction endonuclease subunit S [Psittacicella melopsittaci]RIY33352.1 hypothetical protein CJP74_02120 [Psittacicella melopsittaci]